MFFKSRSRKGLNSGHMWQGKPLGREGPAAWSPPAPPGTCRAVQPCNCLGPSAACAQAGTCQSQPMASAQPPSPGGQIILSLSQSDKITNANSIKSPLKVFNYQTVPKTKDSRSRRGGLWRLMRMGVAETGPGWWPPPSDKGRGQGQASQAAGAVQGAGPSSHRI